MSGCRLSGERASQIAIDIALAYNLGVEVVLENFVLFSECLCTVYEVSYDCALGIFSWFYSWTMFLEQWQLVAVSSPMRRVTGVGPRHWTLVDSSSRQGLSRLFRKEDVVKPCVYLKRRVLESTQLNR